MPNIRVGLFYRKGNIFAVIMPILGDMFKKGECPKNCVKEEYKG
jgi:hypothetical protein